MPDGDCSALRGLSGVMVAGGLSEVPPAGPEATEVGEADDAAVGALAVLVVEGVDELLAEKLTDTGDKLGEGAVTPLVGLVAAALDNELLTSAPLDMDEDTLVRPTLCSAVLDTEVCEEERNCAPDASVESLKLARKSRKAASKSWASGDSGAREGDEAGARVGDVVASGRGAAVGESPDGGAISGRLGLTPFRPLEIFVFRGSSGSKLIRLVEGVLETCIGIHPFLQTERPGWSPCVDGAPRIHPRALNRSLRRPEKASAG